MAAAPSAAEKAKSAELVAQLPCAEQVDLLAQALLREYMHRRGFTATLRTFDEQNPRDARTISSRAVMRQLLNIPVEGRPSRLTAQPAAPGSKKLVAPTYMEELCSYRLTKRDHVLATRRKTQLESKAERAQKDDGAALSESESALLARWQRDRQLWEDPSDAEMTAYSEEAEQHRIQREAAQSLIEEGPHMVEAEAARAEKKRRLKEKRREKAARRKEKKLRRQHSDRRSLDNSDMAADDDLAAAPQPGQRWAPPGALETSTGTSCRTSLDRHDCEPTGSGHAMVTEQDKEDWALNAMSLNPILAAALNEVEEDAGDVRRPWAGGSGAPGGSLPSYAPASTGASAVTLGSAASRTGIAGTGTAFHAKPIGLTSRNEITSAWQPRTSGASASSGGGEVFTYNPSAAPTHSALAKSSVNPPFATGASSILSRRHSTGHAGASGGGGGGGEGGLGATVRGDGDHSAHMSAGGGTGAVRQGFGFRRDSGGEGGSTTATTGGSRKDRRVKLLVD